MRPVLNALYRASAVLACLFLIAIAFLTLLSVVARVFDLAIYSLDEFAGWSMAASTFLGLASTLRNNEHIRVSLLLERLSPGRRRFAEFACLLFATAFMCMFGWQTASSVIMSYDFGEVTQGMVPVPFWIPQSSMAIGAVIMFVALADDLISSMIARMTSHRDELP